MSEPLVFLLTHLIIAVLSFINGYNAAVEDEAEKRLKEEKDRHVKRW